MKCFSASFILICCFFVIPVRAQNTTCLLPIPDDCGTACDLGALPTPPPCLINVDTSHGIAVSFSMSNVGATAGNPYYSTCTAPAADVWYKFKATGAELSIKLNSATLNTPRLTLYQGDSCNNLVLLGCFTGTGGNLTAPFTPITPNYEYYIQISGDAINDTGAFTLTLQNNLLCTNCLLSDSFTVLPTPVNNAYGPGETVTFCYSVVNFSQNAVNWLHGVSLSFGNGWDLSTLAATYLPPSCDITQGAYWGFYASETGQQTGNIYGPGFFYETSMGSDCGCFDGNPGDNYGDGGVGVACSVTFCWKITTRTNLSHGNDLSVVVNTLGDYESGAWTNPGCLNDPITKITPTLVSCTAPAPDISTIKPICFAKNGKVIAVAHGIAPWHYIWKDAWNVIVRNVTNVHHADTITNLAAGQYYVTVIDSSGCSVTDTADLGAAITSPAASNTGPYCTGQTILLYTPSGDLTYSWSGPNGFTSSQQSMGIDSATTAMAGVYKVTVTAAGNCTTTDSTIVVVDTIPVASITATASGVCIGHRDTLTATGGTQYLWSTAETTASIIVFPYETTTYYVTVTNAGGCASVADTVINFSFGDSIGIQGTIFILDYMDTVIFFGTPANIGAGHQWQVNTGTGWQNVTDAGRFSGASTDTLTILHVQQSNNGWQFRCLVSAICNDTSNIGTLDVEPEGIADILKDNNFTIYPNPVTGVMTVNLNGSGYTFIKILDALGREVYANNINTATQNLNLHVDMNNIAAGVYLVQVSGKEGVTGKRIVVQK